MDQASRIIRQFFQVEEQNLHIGGISVTSIVAPHDTPLFIYDGSVLEKKWALLREAFPARFDIYYSVKANPNNAILRLFVAKGSGLEIASAGEFVKAVNAGCVPDRIVFAGPGKTEAELELVLRQGIGEIHAESVLEIRRITGIAQRLGVRPRIALRVNPHAEVQGGAMRMGGKPAPFGIDEELLDEVIDQIDQSVIDLAGIHLFTGTQILDYLVLAGQYRKGLEIAGQVARRLGRPLRTVDFGGGLGIPYFAQDPELELQKLATEVMAMMAEVDQDPWFAGTRFIVEPGRYLVGEAGVYVTRISDIKISRGKKFLIVNGGMNHHLAASGNLGQVIKRNFPIALINRLKKEPLETVDVVGLLCTPLDVLGREVQLPKADVGDLVGIFQSGAYARSASPLGFLSHPPPPEVLVHQGTVSLIQERGKFD